MTATAVCGPAGLRRNNACGQQNFTVYLGSHRHRGSAQQSVGDEYRKRRAVFAVYVAAAFVCPAGARVHDATHALASVPAHLLLTYKYTGVIRHLLGRVLA